MNSSLFLIMCDLKYLNLIVKNGICLYISIIGEKLRYERFSFSPDVGFLYYLGFRDGVFLGIS